MNYTIITHISKTYGCHMECIFKSESICFLHHLSSVIIQQSICHISQSSTRGCRGHDRMVVGFTTTYAINAYHHWCCEFESRSGRGV